MVLKSFGFFSRLQVLFGLLLLEFIHCDVPCELPPAIPQGKVIAESDGVFLLPYEEAEILCDPGYMYTGSTPFVMCEENGEWEEDFGECTEISCDPPQPIANGTIPELLEMNFIAFPHNFEITYRCNEGFRLLGGDSWRFCDKNGWSGTTPRCEEIRCPDPGAPEYGDREGSSFEIGAKVRFSCFTGYNLLGSFERYCMPNGQWTGELARCDTSVNYCPNPGTPINGFKSSTSYDIGDKVGFRCQPGYIHIGSEVRECLPNKTWSGTETKCLSLYDFDNNAKISELLTTILAKKFDKDDRKPDGKENSEHDEQECREFVGENNWNREGVIKTSVSFDGDISSMDTLLKPHSHHHVQFSILNLGYQGRLVLYFAFDVSGSIGERNFRKSIDFAKAIVKKVGVSHDGARVGAVTFSSKAESIFLPMNFYTTEDVLNALDGIVYTGGGTSATSALALIKENIYTDDMYFIKKYKRTVIFIITDGKTNMGGSPEVEAEALKKGGVDIYCIGINGDTRIGTLHKIASKTTYGNEERSNVYIFQDYSSLSWLVQQITNGTLDYSQCGLGMENIVNQNSGRVSDEKKNTEPWPWMAALFLLPTGRRLLEEAELQCGGSVIHENFILTAAHCMYQEDFLRQDLRLRHETEIIVKLGLKNVQDETHVQDFAVKKVIIHEMYRPGRFGARLFDYDIALLQLDRPIGYGPFIRPICLPPKVLPNNSPLYGSKEFGWVIGWGHKGVIVNGDSRYVQYIMSQNLKEIRLPIQSNERCINSLEDRNYSSNVFTDRMFCAGDGKIGNDACKGDSGGPLMQSQMNSDGYLCWTQVGIVSWGIGCGLENTYGYYTHVQSFRSWIDDKIN